MTIQYVILFPTMLFLIFSTVQVALYSYGRSIALTAAHEAVDAQRVFGAKAGVGAAKGRAFIAGRGDALTNFQVVVSVNGNEVTAVVTGQVVSLLPGFSPFAVRQVASGPVEEFVP